MTDDKTRLATPRDMPDGPPVDTTREPSRLAAWVAKAKARNAKPKTPPKPALVPVKPAAPVKTRTLPAARITPSRSNWDVAAVGVLAVLVMAIVAVGLRVGMGALQDAAKAVHIEDEAAKLYWIGVDGLIVVAIVAALVLRHDRAARNYCLAVVAVFTAASGAIQYLHGLGWFTPDPVSRVLPPLPWGVVLLVAFLVIGMIFCATHLFVHTLRRLFPSTQADQAELAAVAPTAQAEMTAVQAEGSGSTQTPNAPDHPIQGGQLSSDDDREVRKWFAAVAVGLLLDSEAKPNRARLSRDFGISDRQAGYVISDVKRERELAAEREAAAAATPSAVTPLPAAQPNLSWASLATPGSVNGSVPAVNP